MSSGRSIPEPSAANSKELRETCLHYDCYDVPNFVATLKKNKLLFKTRQKGEDELSGAGMKKAAGIVKTLAAES